MLINIRAGFKSFDIIDTNYSIKKFGNACVLYQTRNCIGNAIRKTIHAKPCCADFLQGFGYIVVGRQDSINLHEGLFIIFVDVGLKNCIGVIECIARTHREVLVFAHEATAEGIFELFFTP